jgi:hypothetical protein
MACQSHGAVQKSLLLYADFPKEQSWCQYHGFSIIAEPEAEGHIRFFESRAVHELCED